MILEPAQQGGSEARLMRAPVGGRDRVAIRMNEPVIACEPGDRPFDRAMLARLLDAAGEDLVGYQPLTLDVGSEISSQAPRKKIRGVGLAVLLVANERRRAMPADVDASKQIGFRARHLEHARGVEARLSAEDLRIGQKAHLGAAAVQRLADDRKLARRLSPFER